MRKVSVVGLIVLMMMSSVVLAAPDPRGRGSAVVEAFDFGNHGRIGRGSIGDAARNFARGYVARLGAAGSEDFEARVSGRDELGQVHVRMSQSLAGLRVVGAEMIVHIDESTGAIVGINGRFAADKGLPRAARVSAGAAIENAAADFGIGSFQVTGAPELTYIATDDGRVQLAWTNLVAYTDEDGEQLDRIYADAITGDGIDRHPQYHRARNRRTYTCGNGTTLPGTLVMSETSAPSSDVTLAKAHEFAGVTYDYYWTKHSRDSYNNAGATLTSSVHYSTGYNNAFWNGSQMVYGDGDGTTFGPFARALDVVAHELTHAVTGSTAGLVYSKESGALNEGMSDIFGAAAESWKYGVIDSRTWKIGEDIYTPATAGDALRYMNDPAAAGDYDFYPHRYIGTSDNGGVHSNSGIANLAFKLLVTGGTHPRSKSTTTVTGIGMAAAEKIFYRALDVYATSSTNFRVMRDYTLRAAADLYGSGTTNHTQVANAWTAVGNSWTSSSASIATAGASSTLASYTTSTTGVHTGQLFGPSGTDFDLYLQKWNGSSWANVASGATASNNETVQYNGTAGQYRWQVTAYSGTGTYTLHRNRPN